MNLRKSRFTTAIFTPYTVHVACQIYFDTEHTLVMSSPSVRQGTDTNCFNHLHLSPSGFQYLTFRTQGKCSFQLRHPNDKKFIIQYGFITLFFNYLINTKKLIATHKIMRLTTYLFFCQTMNVHKERLLSKWVLNLKESCLESQISRISFIYLIDLNLNPRVFD